MEASASDGMFGTHFVIVKAAKVRCSAKRAGVHFALLTNTEIAFIYVR